MRRSVEPDVGCGVTAKARKEPLLFAERPVGEVLARERRKSCIRTPGPDIAFLAKQGVPDDVLRLAAQLAAIRGTEAREELLAVGFASKRYWGMLADELGLGFLPDLSTAEFQTEQACVTTEAVRSATSLLVRLAGSTVLVCAPARDEIGPLAARLRQSPALARRIRICEPETIRAFLVAKRRATLSHYAVNRLARVLPRFSARHLGTGHGTEGPVSFVCATFGLCLVDPVNVIAALLLACTLFFANCGLWKLAAALSKPRQLRLEPVAVGSLPTYTVLVPLYREAAVVPDLLHHLVGLDYPASKLQTLIVLEQDDHASRSAVARHARSPLIETVIVPPCGPRTKPKALTYALQFARGDYVVVFDAEDRPEPDQLRKAAATFHERPDLGCVQARLAPDSEESWFARMFKLEYAANFEVVLPALAHLGAPLPLGGTSNHFPRAVLEKVGAWDPYNVTEDADLGVRLARFGYRTATILSRTYEEAPVTLRQWLPQRRRWIKGWIQTCLLCFAGRVSPALRLSRREGLAVHGIITAGVVGLLLYPASIVAVAWTAVTAMHGEWPESIWTWLVMVLTAFNIFAVVTAASIASWRGLRAVGALHLTPLILLLPVYWAFMSLAAWQAFFQFLRDPWRWEKTLHGVARDRRTPAHV